MRKIAFAAFASLAALTLSACGSSDDASSDADANNVEAPADQAMAGTEQPVPDASATANDTSTDQAVSNAEDAGERAADAAADVQAAASGDADSGDTGDTSADAD
jgi:hypothetical protein